MSNESQTEEIEVLNSIYDGDENFRRQDDRKFQYMVNHPENEHKNFLLEIVWGEKYPEELPCVNLDAFYNNHITTNVKNEIREILLKEADELLGCAMTYTLFEYAKENAVTLTQGQPEKPEPTHDLVTAPKAEEPDRMAAEKEAKSKMTKAQKRRMWDKMEAGAKGGEKPRGWDWMDIIKHLSQTGHKDGD